MVGIVIVSHSQKLAEGLLDLCQMMANDCPMAAAGGLDDGTFGTSFEKIMAAVESVHGEDGVAILMDMGSAVMTTEMVLEMLDDPNISMVDCPITEGAVAASVTAVGGGSLAEVVEAAEGAREMTKF